ncbi:MAG: CPBP family intramembrane metalloprotease [Bacteroidales bacterium]|nr:CPBP family intramembrane metalloprotease [Bacteroidales bacterium]
MIRNNNSYPSLQQAWVVFAIFLAASIAIGLLIGAINEMAGIQNISISNFIGYNVSLLFVIWFAWRNRKPNEEKQLYFRPVPSVLYPLLVILTVSLAVFLDPLTNLLPIPDWVEDIFALLTTRDMWTFMMVGITGPILEEVLFRGIILDGFLTRYKPGKAIFWSAFLFGLFHLNPWQFIPGFLIGLLLGYIYMKTRSLIPVILVHIVNNSFSYLIVYFYGEDVMSFKDLFTESGDYNLFLAVSTVIFVISIFALYKIVNQNNEIWTFNSKTDSS